MNGSITTIQYAVKSYEREITMGGDSQVPLRTAGAKMCYKKSYPELSEEVRECKKSDENLV